MNVLFVVMPFGAIRPAMGVSLLQAELAAIGIPSRVRYLTIPFAQRVGVADYDYVAERAPSQSLAGDWVFAGTLGGPRGDRDAAYLADFAARFHIFGPVEPAIATLKRCRAHAEPFIAACLDEVSWEAYDLVGFTSTFSQHVASLALARRVKERFPHVRIAFGGANCEDVMGLQVHRSFPLIDYVCTGEADVSFPRLVRALRDGEEPAAIPGIVWRRDAESRFVDLLPERVQDLDQLPTPDYSDYFEQLSALRPLPATAGGVLLESSRGCWWGEKQHCTFCGLNGMSMAFRRKSARRVLEEMEVMSDRHGPRFVEMVDNILDMAYFRDLIPELKRRKLRVGLFYETKANLTKSQVRALRDAGIATIQPGIESLSSDVLRLMRKGTSAIQNLQLLKWCKEYGIVAFWNLIYGFPGEDPRAYEGVAESMASLHHLQPPHGIGPIRLDRFSPHYTSPAQFGIVNVRPDRSYGHIYDLADDALARLAYFFEHDYADGRRPEQYAGALRRAVVDWHAEGSNRGLWYVDHGDMLAVWDLRPRAPRAVTILAGSEREVYLYCDQHRSFQQIREHAAAARPSDLELQALLDRLVGERSMIRLDEQYLSLAVALEAGAASDRRPAGIGVGAASGEGP